MRQPCEERERLWRALAQKTSAYADGIKRFKRPLKKEDFENAARSRLAIQEYRALIRQHCAEHGCDPKYLDRLQSGEGSL